ncbi:hypothetical protein SAMN04489752_1479 [Brevibacterium siliguriense]|uniref:Uncharacterized protein n=1 Tax=Brevibacterium siliguriense TaxID=1136497 RepID=A0A1H1RBY5_9MICO|nr:hypothetical protein SAMN04489752_1479 [Brevibacterium siliguriense]
MTDDPVANLVRLQLVALTEMRGLLREQNSQLIRLENKVDALFIAATERKTNE